MHGPPSGNIRARLGRIRRHHDLIFLCRYHHRLVYEGGFPVDAIDDRKFEFRRPDGRMVSTGGPQKQTTTDIGILSCRLGLHIDADSAVTRWAGEPIDCGLAIDGLLWFD